jgi:hypothetical protein
MESDFKAAIEEEMKRHEMAVKSIAKNFNMSEEYILVC